MPNPNTSDSLTAAMMRHLHTLADDIGPRPAGSSAHAAAAHHIEAALREAGLQVEDMPFTCPGWRCAETALLLDGVAYRAAANLPSPACDLTAPTVAAGTIADLDAADITGKIAVLYDDLSRQPLTPLNCPIYNIDEHQHINRTLLAKRPAAVIMVNPYHGNVERRIEDVDFTLPSVTVPAEVGAALLHRLGQPVTLRIDAEQAPATARHLLAFKPGPRPERIALMAHYDTKLDTPGAWDNGAGIAALLGLAAQLAPRDLGCTLEFIAFGDEENYSQDHVVYIRERGDQFDGLIAAINMDGIAHILGHNTITMMMHSAPFEAAVQEVAAGYPRVGWVAPWPESNHSTFAFNGVPALAFGSSAEWQTTRHLPTDTPLLISPAGLREVVDLITEIVCAIADCAPAWTRPQPEA